MRDTDTSELAAVVRLIQRTCVATAQDLTACVEGALVREREVRLRRRQTEIEARAEAQQPYRIGRMEGSAHEIDVRRMGAEFSQALEHFTSAGHIELSSGSLCVSDRNVIAQMRAARQLRGSSDLATQRMSRVLSQICKQL